MYKIINILIIFCWAISAHANWKVVEKQDEFTDEKVKFIAFSNDTHRLQISRHNETGYVWFFITRKEFGTFEPDSLVELRVDKNDTKNIDPKFLKRLSSGVGQTFYQWEPSTIAFSVWHGKEEQGKRCGFISELLNGDELKIRYRINTLETRSTSINLSGIKSDLISTLGLKICGKS